MTARSYPPAARRGPDEPAPRQGGGEAGCAGALPSVMNALLDALSRYGIHHLDMPATPERVWRTIQAARAR